MGLTYDFTYINSKGMSIDFGGHSPFWVEGDSFRSYEYSYSELNGKISGFYIGLNTYEFDVSIESDDTEEAVELTELLRRISSYDIKTNTPGTIKIGEYQTEGYIIGLDYSSEGDDDFYGYETGLSITIAIENPIWYTEELVRFKPQVISPGSSEGLNYPFNYPFNYGARRNIYRQFNNDDVLSCPFRMLVYGRAVDPSIRIGSNLYQVNATIAQGGYLVIDSRNKGTESTILETDCVAQKDLVSIFSRRFQKGITMLPGIIHSVSIYILFTNLRYLHFSRMSDRW